MRLFWMIFRYAIIAYFFAFIFVFNIFRAARPYDVESENVVCGPRPKWLFCRPSYGGIYYDGHEWPFVVFRPFCKTWIRMVGCYEYK